MKLNIRSSDQLTPTESLPLVQVISKDEWSIEISSLDDLLNIVKILNETQYGDYVLLNEPYSDDSPWELYLYDGHLT